MTQEVAMFFTEIPDGAAQYLSPMARESRSAALRGDWDTAVMCWNLLAQERANKVPETVSGVK